MTEQELTIEGRIFKIAGGAGQYTVYVKGVQGDFDYVGKSASYGVCLVLINHYLKTH